MTDPDIAALVKGISEGARNACLRLTDDWQLSGKSTFNIRGAWALYWAAGLASAGALCEADSREFGRYLRPAIRLTPLGLRVRAHLQAQQ